MLIEFDFTMIVNDEHLISINKNDGIGSNVLFVSFAEDSNKVTKFNHEVCVFCNAWWEGLLEFEVLQWW